MKFLNKLFSKMSHMFNFTLNKGKSLEPCVGRRKNKHGAAENQALVIHLLMKSILNLYDVS